MKKLYTIISILLLCILSALFLTNTTMAQSSNTIQPTRRGKITGTVANVFNNPGKSEYYLINVCAENTSTKKRICTKTNDKTDSPYELNVPFGDYFVYSYFDNLEKEQGRAYYGSQTYCLPFNQKAGDYSEKAISKREECRKNNSPSKPRRLSVRRKTLNYVRPWDDAIITK